jgi:hypothetical protein
MDGFVKSPISALSFILRHCGVIVVRQAERRYSGLSPKAPVPLALILNFLFCHPFLIFYEFIMMDFSQNRSYCLSPFQGEKINVFI